MSDRRICPNCGDDVPAASPHKLCPRCLLQVALGSSSAAASHYGGGADTVSRNAPSRGVIDTLGESVGPIARVLLRDTAIDEEPSPIIRPTPGHDTSTRYRIDGEIARGGMGEILKGRDPDLGRDVAIKVLREDLRENGDLVRRFVEEAQIGGQLQHPGVVPIYELGTFADLRPFFCMKLVKGQTLADQLEARRDPTHDLPRCLSIFESIAQTIAYAHTRGVIHRDLKPSNVMVGSFGEVQVMDWGLAKVLARGGIVNDAQAGKEKPPETLIATARSGSEADLSRAGSIMGTPSYMAPEQARGETDLINERADVFALGSILCEILTGSPAFTGRNSNEILRKAARGETADALVRLESSGAEGELVSLAKDCLAVEPQDRPHDGNLVSERITAYLAGVQQRAQAAERERAVAVARAIEERRRRRVQLTLTASILATALLGLSAVLAVQTKAKGELALANSKLNEALNRETEANSRVQQRYDLAVKAIETFHKGVSEDFLLQEDRFKSLRERLLNSATDFYEKLGVLLKDASDLPARRALLAANFEVADLADKVGRKEHALELHRRVLAGRESLANEFGADPALAVDVSKSLVAVGQCLKGMQKTDEGLAAYDRACAVVAAPDGGPPQKIDALIAFAYALSTKGNLLTELGRFDEAVAALKRARDLQETLAAANPADLDRQTALSKTISEIGYSLVSARRPAEAVKVLEKASEIQQKLVDAKPAVIEFQAQLAKIHMSIARTLEDRPAVALKTWEKAMAIQEKLTDANPSLSKILVNLSVTRQNMALLLIRLDRPDEALNLYRRSLAAMRRAVDADPIPKYEHGLARAQIEIGNFLDRMSRPAEAVPLFEQALPVFYKLANTPPYSRYPIASAHCDFGRVLVHLKRFPEAFQQFDKGLQLSEKHARENPASSNYALELALSLSYRGWANMKADRPLEAATDLKRGHEILARQKKLNGFMRFEWCRLQALLAHLAKDKKSDVSGDEAEKFADRAIAILRSEVKDGAAQISELKDHDFDAIRDRKDFQALLLDLTFPADPFVP